MQIGPRIREFPVNAILAAYESLSSSSPGPRYDAAGTIPETNVTFGTFIDIYRSFHDIG